MIITQNNLDRDELLVFEKIISNESKGIDLHTLIFEIAIENQMYSSEDIQDILEDLEKMNLITCTTKKCEKNGDELIILHSV